MVPLREVASLGRPVSLVARAVFSCPVHDGHVFCLGSAKISTGFHSSGVTCGALALDHAWVCSYPPRGLQRGGDKDILPDFAFPAVDNHIEGCGRPRHRCSLRRRPVLRGET